ncbi:MAG: hypothetical protein GXX96_34480 [Planctomycetaceae bacterium]|nr:hypothetical protein [Planctomycetaceae bacterium]
MNTRVAKRSLIGGLLAGAVGGGLAWGFGLAADAFGVTIVTAMYGAAGAVAGIASLWRQRGLPLLTCVAVVAACMLAARLTTVLVVGFRKFNDYPDAPMLLAGAIGVVIVLICRKPVVARNAKTAEVDADVQAPAESLE